MSIWIGRVLSLTQIEMQDAKRLLCDKEVARIVGMSPPWVRVQRLKRRRGQDHTLTIDPVMLGRNPRYRLGDVYSWLADLPQG